MQTPTPETAARTVVCTIVSKNYLAAARVLMRSVQAQHQDLACVTLLVDQVDGYFAPEAEPFHLIEAATLDIPNWPHFSMKYDIMELNTAVKPYLLEYLFDTLGAEKVIYFDPDIWVYQRLDDLLALLDQHTAVLTPHILAPLNDGYSPDERDFLRTGTYNLGFFAISERGPWREMLRWWQGHIYSHCTREITQGLFVDQHWMDLLPTLFEGVYIWRHPGANLAYWKLKNRELDANGAGGAPQTKTNPYSVDGWPLIFFHFSGFSPEQPQQVSKHQNRFSMADLSAAYQACFAAYAEALRNNGYAEVKRWPYAYGRFPDGTPISDILRICLRLHDPDGKRWPNPYELSGEDVFLHWAIEPDNLAALQYLSPYAFTLYQQQPDLGRAFPDLFHQHEAAFARWFVNASGTGPAFAAVYTDPVRERLKHNGAAPKQSAARRQVPLRERILQTWRYYRDYPHKIKPYLPANIMDSTPDIYTGPGGMYGAIRKALIQLGVQRRVRKAIGLRTILSARHFFTYPAQEIQLLTLDLPTLSAAQPDTQRGPGVNVIGYLHSESGVGQAARNDLKALEAVGYPLAVLPIETYDTARKGDQSSDHLPQGLQHQINLFHINADMTYPVYHLIGENVYQQRYNIGFWFWEMADFPPEWDQCFALYDEIWVGSSFIQEALSVRSPVPVLRVDLPIEVKLPAQTNREAFGIPDERFVYLYIFDAQSVIERKNPWALINAYERAFDAVERARDTLLVIKVTNLARFPAEAERLRHAVKRVGGLLIENYFDREQTNALINACDAYVSLHRSEGFGLSLAEAMYLGKPVIATAYSGNMDFMTPNNSYMVPYELVRLERDHPPYEAGQYWAEPNINEAAALLRHVYADRDDAAQVGQNAAAYIRRFYSGRVCGEKIARRLDAIYARQPQHQPLSR